MSELQDFRPGRNIDTSQILSVDARYVPGGEWMDAYPHLRTLGARLRAIKGCLAIHPVGWCSAKHMAFWADNDHHTRTQRNDVHVLGQDDRGRPTLIAVHQYAAPGQRGGYDSVFTYRRTPTWRELRRARRRHS